VLGNEAADQAAKEAAGLNQNTLQNSGPELEPLRILIAITKSAICQTLRDEWEHTWETAKHSRELYQLGVRLGKGLLGTYTGTY
jgi:hypothetical protein